LLFHNWQDAHHNIKPPEYTRGFHIELSADWFLKHDISSTDYEGSLQLKSPILKSLLNKVFLESKINDNQSELSIELLMLSIFSKIKLEDNDVFSKKPQWVKKLQEMLRETNTNFSLTSLSAALDIHPAHLSREFPKHFGITLGQYIRRLRLNKAIMLIADNSYNMTEICYKCGFYDQSHFISTFKSIYKTTPLGFLKKIH